MDDLDCDCDLGDCDCDGDCCCCCNDCDCDTGKTFSWNNIACLICMNIGNNNNTRHNNYHDDSCHRCCCWCCYDDYYPRQQRPRAQLKEESSDPNNMVKQKQEEFNRRKESEQWEFKYKIIDERRRKEAAIDEQHSPSCPCRGINIPKNIYPCKCSSLISPSSPSFDLDLDPPMIQRFQALDREKYRRGYGLYRSPP